MTCKDCIHFKLCEGWAKWAHYSMDYGRGTCEDFEDRSQDIKLPCKIGDIAYATTLNLKDEKNKWRVKAGTISSIQITRNGKIGEIGVSHVGRATYGIHVFLTREEAEKAVKEMNGERKEEK